MKQYLLITLFLLIRLSVLAVSNNDKQGDSTTLLGLYYGMDSTEVAEKYTHENITSTIEGLSALKLSDVWFEKFDDCFYKYHSHLWIFVDSLFPNMTVKHQINNLMNDILYDYYYDSSTKDIFENKPKDINASTNFKNYWAHLFNQISRKYQKPKHTKSTSYQLIPESRVCIFAHKIYEDSHYATYIINDSYNLHGGGGCKSEAKYVTLNKKSGNILSIEELTRDFDKKDLEAQVWNSYVKEASKKGFEPSEHSGKDILPKANGAAIVNEGILLYFYPYNIGCGAEDQYNLIIQK